MAMYFCHWDICVQTQTIFSGEPFYFKSGLLLLEIFRLESLRECTKYHLGIQRYLTNGSIKLSIIKQYETIFAANQKTSFAKSKLGLLKFSEFGAKIQIVKTSVYERPKYSDSWTDCEPWQRNYTLCSKVKLHQKYFCTWRHKRKCIHLLCWMI